MKTITVNEKPFALPTTWEELTPDQRIYAFSILERVLQGDLTENPHYALILFLCKLTGYHPSPKYNAYRETINFNLLRIAEQLTVPFAIERKGDIETITPNMEFSRNPFPFIRLGHDSFPGARFDRDTTVRTNLTARQFIDGYDLLTAITHLPSDEQRIQCLNQMIALLYPADPDYYGNLVSSHMERIADLYQPIKFGIVCWFSSVVKFYSEHPRYKVLFKRNTPSEDDPKIDLGMNEVALFLQTEGYGEPVRMNLTDYFDAQIKSLRDTIVRALASGAKPEEISGKTGIPFSTIIELS